MADPSAAGQAATSSPAGLAGQLARRQSRPQPLPRHRVPQCRLRYTPHPDDGLPPYALADLVGFALVHEHHLHGALVVVAGGPDDRHIVAEIADDPCPDGWADTVTAAFRAAGGDGTITA